MRDDGDLFARTHRVLPEPCPVWVQLSVVFDAYRPPDYRQATVRDTAFGVDLAATVPGELLGWYRLNAGGGYWWGLARFVAGSRNGRLRLALTQLVPATALQPRAAGTLPRAGGGQGGAVGTQQ